MVLTAWRASLCSALTYPERRGDCHCAEKMLGNCPSLQGRWVVGPGFSPLLHYIAPGYLVGTDIDMQCITQKSCLVSNTLLHMLFHITKHPSCYSKWLHNMLFQHTNLLISYSIALLFLPEYFLSNPDFSCIITSNSSISLNFVLLSIIWQFSHGTISYISYWLLWLLL